MNRTGTFGTELIRAAQYYVGSPAVFHQNMVGNCIETPSPRCHEVGMSPEEGFDCSGLMIRSICDVLGREVGDWPLQARHVRDMYKMAQDDSDLLATTDIRPGSMLTTAHHYKVNGVLQAVPGHIGVVSEINRSGYIQFVHASPPAGRVEQGPVSPKATMLGAISLSESWLLSDSTLVE